MLCGKAPGASRILARLPQLGNASTLGCELQFVHMNTLQVLADPIQSAISTNQKYYVIAKQCMVEAGHKGQLKGEVKAVRVLCSRNGKIPPQAFSFCTEIRHVLVAHCSQLQQLCLPRMLRTIEQEAFYKCTSLKEVSTPPSLLYIARHAFAGCTHLRIILKQGKSSTPVGPP